MLNAIDCKEMLKAENGKGKTESGERTTNYTKEHGKKVKSWKWLKRRQMPNIKTQISNNEPMSKYQ